MQGWTATTGNEFKQKGEEKDEKHIREQFSVY